MLPVLFPMAPPSGPTTGTPSRTHGATGRALSPTPSGPGSARSARRPPTACASPRENACADGTRTRDATLTGLHRRIPKGGRCASPRAARITRQGRQTSFQARRTLQGASLSPAPNPAPLDQTRPCMLPTGPHGLEPDTAPAVRKSALGPRCGRLSRRALAREGVAGTRTDRRKGWPAVWPPLFPDPSGCPERLARRRLSPGWRRPAGPDAQAARWPDRALAPHANPPGHGLACWPPE